MADDFRFIVKIMPPRRPTDSLLARRQPQRTTEEPIATILVPANPQQKFEDVWKSISQRFNRSNYPAHIVDLGWFHKLQNRHRADIDLRDTVGALGYNKSNPSEELELIMLQNAIDRDGSIPSQSNLRPSGFNKRPLTDEQEAWVKRRKVQQERYGAAVEDLDEETPVISREDGDASQSSAMAEDLEEETPMVSHQNGNAQHSSDDESNYDQPARDADGFAIPQKIKRTSKKRDLIASSAEGEREGEVLVEDSQVQPATQRIPDSLMLESQVTPRGRIGRSEPKTIDRFGSITNSILRGRTAAPSSLSSPLQKLRQAQAVQHPSVLSQVRTPATSRSGSRQSDAPSNGQSNTKQKGPPTPVSGKGGATSVEPPDSAQRPKSTLDLLQASARESRRTAPLLPMHHQEEDLMDDPIDDQLLQEIADHPKGIVEIKVGRLPSVSRTHSVFSTSVQSADLDIPNSQQTGATSFNAFDDLTSSQVASRLNARARTSAKGWTKEEDAAMLEGLRQGWSIDKILKDPDIDRSSSAARSRRLILLAKHPELQPGAKGTPNPNLEATPTSSPHSSGLCKQPWSVVDVDVLCKALAEGLDPSEIQALYLPRRSEESVIRKCRRMEASVWGVEERRFDWPNNTINVEDWTSKDNLRLRRAYREGLTAEVAWRRWYKKRTRELVYEKMKAFEQQMADHGHRPGDHVKRPRHSSQASSVIDSSPTMHRGHVNSSTALRPDYAQTSRLSSQASSVVASSPTEYQRHTRPSTTGAKQTKLTFDPAPRDKGKRPVVTHTRPSIAELDAQYGRLPARGLARQSDNTSTTLDRPVPDSRLEMILKNLPEEDQSGQDAYMTSDAELRKKAKKLATVSKGSEQELFEDLKHSDAVMRAITANDQEELSRLNAKERRMRRERDVAKGKALPQSVAHLHPQGPAQHGDDDSAEEDVVRQDDDVQSNHDALSSDHGGEQVEVQSDVELEQDVIDDRHFSEVEDDGDESSALPSVPDVPLTLTNDNSILMPDTLKDLDSIVSQSPTKQDVEPSKQDAKISKQELEISNQEAEPTYIIQPSEQKTAPVLLSPSTKSSPGKQTIPVAEMPPPPPPPLLTQEVSFDTAEAKKAKKRKRKERRENARMRRQSGSDYNSSITGITASTSSTTSLHDAPSTSSPRVDGGSGNAKASGQAPERNGSGLLRTPSSRAGNFAALLKKAHIPDPPRVR